MASEKKSSKSGKAAGGVEKLKDLNARPGLVKAAKALREAIPGDGDLGDALSAAGDEQAHKIGKRLSEIAGEQPSVMNEFGMGALKAWQSISESRGRGKGKRELAILFTDLVDFSDWALEAGDDDAVELLRRVGEAIEPAIEDRGGEIVKRLGDGLMAVFDDPAEAVEAALEAGPAAAKVKVAGHSPELRAGVHLGKPRKVSGDYFGVDVNVAARVADAGRGGEVLITEPVRERLADADVKSKRRRFKAKGAPKDLTVFTAYRE